MENQPSTVYPSYIYIYTIISFPYPIRRILTYTAVKCTLWYIYAPSYQGFRFFFYLKFIMRNWVFMFQLRMSLLSPVRKYMVDPRSVPSTIILHGFRPVMTVGRVVMVCSMSCNGIYSMSHDDRYVTYIRRWRVCPPVVAGSVESTVASAIYMTSRRPHGPAGTCTLNVRSRSMLYTIMVPWLVSDTYTNCWSTTIDCRQLVSVVVRDKSITLNTCAGG